MLTNLLMGIALMGLCLAVQIALLARTLIYYAVRWFGGGCDLCG